jgi:septal ring factor EnvC (AmiA/AmiB activator)
VAGDPKFMMRWIGFSLIWCVAVAALIAQAPQPARSDAQSRRVDQRIRALQRESEELARQTRTLVGELRKLEIERDLRAAQATQAETAAAEAAQTLERATARLAALEQQRIAQLPDLELQLVDVYKRGRTGYAQLIFGAQGLREFARATRAVSALAAINERRLVEHRTTLAALSKERATLQRTAAELEARGAAARGARIAAERAVTARAALIARIDSQRDLTAQYVGELQDAYNRLQQRVTAGGTGDEVSVPLAPFRGALEWPAVGRLSGRFGQTDGRLGGTAVRNGIEIAAPEEAIVRAVHGGTIGYADVFTGFGNLVIVEHGGANYTLYGYLGSISVARGDLVDTGAELGRVGLAPAGPPALYFEMRIDGRSVDPLQWLKPLR